MSYEIHLTWKYFARICANRAKTTSINDHDWIDSRLFHIRTGKSLLRDMGGDATETLSPLVLEPKTNFYNKLFTRLQRAEKNWKKFPLTFPIRTSDSEHKDLRANFTLHQYGDWLCLTIALDPFVMASVENLFKVQKLTFQHELSKFAQQIFDNTIASNTKICKLKYFPCMRIVCSPEAAPISDSCLSGILTRHFNVNSAIVEDLLRRNRDHQLDKTLLLCEKQGVLFYIPPNISAEESRSSARRFKSAIAMIEVSYAIGRLLSDHGSISASNYGAIEKLINNSNLVFASSVSGRILWQVFMREFILQDLLQQYKFNMAETANLNPAEKSQTNILCIAAADVELKAIRTFLTEQLGRPVLRTFPGKESVPVLAFTDGQTNAVWYLGSQDGQGNGFAIQDTTRLIQTVKPHHIVMVGMCMGMPSRSLTAGTVIVPNALFCLDHQRVTKDGSEFRPRGESVGEELHRYARLLASDAIPYPVIVDKKIACASTKIEDSGADIVKFLESNLKDVVAYDMEGWGFYRSAAEHSALWIKAVADSGEAQGSSQDAQIEKHITQTSVTGNAVDFAFRLFRFISSSQQEANLN